MAKIPFAPPPAPPPPPPPPPPVPVTTTLKTSSAQAKMGGTRAKTSSAARSPKPLMNPSALKISRKKRKSY